MKVLKLMVLLFLSTTISSFAQNVNPPLGMNLEAIGGRANYFVDLMKSSRYFSKPGTQERANLGTNGWPKENFDVVVFDARLIFGFNPSIQQCVQEEFYDTYIDDPDPLNNVFDRSGIYYLYFDGASDITITTTNANYATIDPHPNIDNKYIIEVKQVVNDSIVGSLLHLRFEGVDSPTDIQNIRIVPAAYDNSNQTFTNEILSIAKQYDVLRFMDFTSTNYYCPTVVECEPDFLEVIPAYMPSQLTFGWGQRRMPTAPQQSPVLPPYDRCDPSFNGNNDETIFNHEERQGVAWEYVVEMANELMALRNGEPLDIWINIPLTADDSYILGLAALLQSSLNPGIRVYVEYGNEVWNGGLNNRPDINTGSQYHYNVGLALKEIQAGDQDYYAPTTTNDYAILSAQRLLKRLYRISKIFGNVFGQNTINDRIRVVYNVQMGSLGLGAPNIAAIQWFEDLKNGDDFKYGPLSRYVYGIAGGDYYGARYNVNNGMFIDTERIESDDPQVILNAIEENSGRIAYTSPGALPQYTSAQYRLNLLETADKFNLVPLCYEGGSDTGDIPTNQSAEDIVCEIGERGGIGVFRDPEAFHARIEAERSFRMADIINWNLNDWFANGGGAYCYFGLSGAYSRFGSWGITEDLRQHDSNPSHKVNAIRAVKNSSLTCEAAEALRDVVVTATQAYLDWSATGIVQYYDFTYWEAAKGGPTTIRVNRSYLLLDNLRPNTQYNWTVRAFCVDGTAGVLSNQASFTTGSAGVAFKKLRYHIFKCDNAKIEDLEWEDATNRYPMPKLIDNNVTGNFIASDSIYECWGKGDTQGTNRTYLAFNNSDDDFLHFDTIAPGIIPYGDDPTAECDVRKRFQGSHNNIDLELLNTAIIPTKATVDLGEYSQMSWFQFEGSNNNQDWVLLYKNFLDLKSEPERKTYDFQAPIFPINEPDLGECSPVMNLSHQGNGLVQWTGSGDSYYIRYRVASIPYWTPAPSTSGFSFTIPNYQPQVEYVIEVIALCGGKFSIPSYLCVPSDGSGNPGSCQAVPAESMSFDCLSGRGEFDLDWADLPQAESYQLKVWAVDDPATLIVDEPALTRSEYTGLGIHPFDWEVRVNCSNGVSDPVRGPRVFWNYCYGGVDLGIATGNELLHSNGNNRLYETLEDVSGLNQIEMIKESNVRWVRIVFRRPTGIAPDPEYAWIAKYDEAINTLLTSGVKIIGLVDRCSVYDNGWDIHSPAWVAEYTNLFGKIIERYYSKVAAFESINEPRESFSSEDRECSPMTAAVYADVLQAVYDRSVPFLHATKIITGPILSVEPHIQSSIDFFNEVVVALDGRTPYDGIGWHFYPHKCAGSPGTFETEFSNMLGQITNGLSPYLNEDVKLWMTEYGWNDELLRDRVATTPFNSADELKAFLIEKSYQVYLQYAEDIEMVTYFKTYSGCWDEGGCTSNPNNRKQDWGLLRLRGGPDGEASCYAEEDGSIKMLSFCAFRELYPNWRGPNFNFDCSTTNIRGETGTVSTNQANATTWHKVYLNHRYKDPVVVMGPPSYNGGDPVTVRVRNVSSNSFEYQLDEWDYLDGAHVEERLSYLVLEAGTYFLEGGLQVEAGHKTVNHQWANQNFSAKHKTPPVVLAQCVSDNESSAVVTRLRSISASGFHVSLQEEQASKGYHTKERVDWIALKPMQAEECEIRRTKSNVDQYWRNYFFANKFKENCPILAMVQTTNSSDPITLRCKDRTAISSRFRAEEEKSYDTETKVSSGEEVGYAIFQPGFLRVPNFTMNQLRKKAESTAPLEAAKILPNPFDDQVRIEINPELLEQLGGSWKAVLYDLRGQETDRSPQSETEAYEWNLAGLPPGIYFLQIVGATGHRVESFKLIKQ